MKVGLLMCDHVNLNYQDEFGDYNNMFQALFPQFEFTLYDVVNNVFPKNIDECDLYMATGSKHSVYDDLAWIDKTKDLIRSLYENGKYFVGICFGHQLLGEALGGKVGKSSHGWCVGVHDFEIAKKEKWMTPFKNNLGMLMMCQDQILQLPNDSTVIAKSQKCPVAMFTVGQKMLGLQSHPEFSKTYDQMLMETRMNRMGDEVARMGITSLSKPIHTGIIKSWVLEFVDQDG